jgi:protocatechuate 3,4-dioxygenase beta subunit
MTGNINLDPGENDPTNDAGLFPTTPPQLASLGDKVFNDLDKDGIQDPGEPGLANVTVQLKDCNNNILQTTQTDPNGIYSFTNLTPGCYRVGIVVPGGYTVSPKDAGGNDATDSDIDPVTSMTGNINLDPDENDPTNDAGLFPTTPPQLASLGDKVFDDLDKDGIQDPGEPGLANVTVQLKDCNNNILQTTQTDPNGIYSFTNLTPGCYRVGVVVPGGYTVSPKDAGGNDATDSDIDPVTSMTGNINLDPGENDPTNDAGLYPTTPPQPASLGDKVFNDLDKDGIQDPGEPGLANVTVQLKDCSNNILQTTQTDPNGIYSFTNLTPGCYRVGVVVPGGYTVSPQNVGNDATDSDINPVTFMTDNINLDPGENDPTNDAGLFPTTPPQPASLGDFVWNDLDQDGVQDFGEPGVPGITVKLFKCDGTFVSSTTTNNVGFYQFTNLASNMQYYVEFSGYQALGYQLTTADAQNDTQNNIDSDADPNGKTACTFLSPGENDNSIDAGVFKPAPVLGSIGNFVWNDLDQDGVQDPNEPGIREVTVRLRDCTTNAVLAVTTTDANGLYLFSDRPAGCYRIEVVLPTGFVFSPNNVGDDTRDSDVDRVTGLSGNIDLSEGENDLTNDAGIYQPLQPVGSIGDKVWNDQNQNGVQDVNEPGLIGVAVKLLDCNGNLISATITDANGNYLFNNLPSGSYIVEFVKLNGYEFSPKDAGITNDALDSDAGANGRTDCFNLAPGQNDPTRDAGLYLPTSQPASVGDKVWRDDNGNGIQDPNEPGVQNVLVKLFTCAGTYIGQFSTNANGGYQFINLTPGSYFLQFSNLPSGFVFTGQDAGTDDSKDSDVIDPATGNTACFDLAPGQNDPTRDAGIKPATGTGPATIGDRVWFDSNQDGVQDPGEPGIPGVFVILNDCFNNFKDFAVTDAQGLYLFTNVTPGQYTIKFANPGTYNGVSIQPTLPNIGDDSKDSDADWLGVTSCFTVNPGETNLTYDGGFKSDTPVPVCTINGSVSNVVCNDNGTPNNPADDKYTFTLIVNGTSTGAWGFDVPALGLYTLQYGQPYNLGPFNINAGTLTLVINDHDVNGCTTTVTVQPPAPCSVAPLPSLSINDITVNENAGTATLQICASAPAATNITVQYSTANGSALSGADYTTTNGTATILAGSTCTVVIIPIVDDNVNEPTESFTVNLSNPGGGTIADNQGVVTILDNDQPTFCDNVTNGGTIGYDQTSCVGFDPAPITSLSLPTGGSGAIEYIWLSSTVGCPDNINQAIPGTNSPTYDPPFINQTTWYIRCSRRVGCTIWVESNCIKKEVCTGGGGCNVSLAGGPGTITVSGLNAPNVDVQIFNANWSPVFSCFNNCNKPQLVTNQPAGTYFVKVQMWDATWNAVCTKEGYVTVTGSTSLIAPVSGTDEKESPATIVEDRNGEDETMSELQVKALDFRLYPNPANTFVTLDMEAILGKEVQIELLDNLGRKVRRIKLDEVQTPLYRIELDGLREGLYLVWVKTPGEKPSVKQLMVAKR